MSNFLRNNANKLPTAMLITTLGLTGCAASGVEKYQDNIVPDAEGIIICDGANVRNAPHRNNRPDMLEDGVVVTKIDFGNAPEGTCVKIPAEAVYRRTEPNNGTWFGVTEATLANKLTDTNLNPAKTENVLWINQQRASVALEDGKKE